MHLINVHSYKLRHFFTEKLPMYAILSHTWGDEEVTYQDMTQNIASAQKKKGFKKIAYTCKQAIKDGLDWAWVDTCCIDKTSSAELSEAINSMYNWYRTSMRCYAYLLDYHVVGTNFDEDQFRQSRWFTRGWTLQELVAPATIDFYSRGWEHFGTKATLASSIEVITSIEADFLLHRQPLSSSSVAKRMSWAAKRQTTRAEDIAYCLLGIFDINMPLLYGEGQKAFYRLQTEILREYDDESLLAWLVPRNDPRVFMPIGVLASSPSDFSSSSNVVPSGESLNGVSAMKKKGLKVKGQVFRADMPRGSRFLGATVFRIPLHCHTATRPQTSIAILAIVSKWGDGATLCTRIATPDHCDDTDHGPVTALVHDISTVYLTRAAPPFLHDKFHALKGNAKLHIKRPWKYSRIQVATTDFDTHPSGKKERAVEVELANIQSHEVIIFSDQTELNVSGSGKPYVLQALFTLTERTEDDESRVQRTFELRCALQLGKMGLLHAAHLEWKRLAAAEVANLKANKTEVQRQPVDSSYTELRSDDLVPWAEAKLKGVGVQLKAEEDELVVEEHVDDGVALCAALNCGSLDGIFGALPHFLLKIYFSTSK